MGYGRRTTDHGLQQDVGRLDVTVQDAALVGVVHRPGQGLDQDGGLPAVRVRELAGAVAGGANTFDMVQYGDQGTALNDLRNGRINGLLTIPPEFSRRVLQKNEAPAEPGCAEYLRQRCLAAGTESLHACYPGDIYRLVKAITEYEGRPVRMTKANIDRAVALYFARA